MNPLRTAVEMAFWGRLLMNMFDVLKTARALPVWGTLKRRTSSPRIVTASRSSSTSTRSSKARVVAVSLSRGGDTVL
jgi:hypothetical protein